MFGFLRKKSDQQEVWINVSNRTVIRLLLIIIASLLILAAARKTSHALILIFSAFFLSIALNAPVHWIAEHLPGKLRGRRAVATAISFLLVILVLGAFLASIVPPLTRQTDKFIHEAPSLVQNVRSQNGNLGKLVRKYNLQSQVTKFSQQLSQRTQHLAGTALSSLGSVASSVFSMLAIVVLTFMMLAEGPMWASKLRKLIPQEQRGHVGKLSSDMYNVIRGYVNGQVILAALAAAMITPVLFILGIGYPLALLVVIFVCGLIPMVGHFIGAFIITIVALFHSIPAAIIILAYYILYMQIEAYIIQPRIQSNTTNLTPLLVFAAVLVGVSFSGIFGGLVAIPIAGCLRVVIVDYMHSRGMLLDEPALSRPKTDETT